MRALLAHLPRYTQHLQRYPHSLLARLLGTAGAGLGPAAETGAKKLDKEGRGHGGGCGVPRVGDVGYPSSSRVQGTGQQLVWLRADFGEGRVLDGKVRGNDGAGGRSQIWDGPKGAGFGSDISRRGYVGGAMSEDPAPLRLDFEVNGVGTDWLRAWGRVDPGLSSLGPLT